ncbi:YXWGXW repeat-containing protein [uncultured Xylophilus sp.]|uniref:YXWGXW repeat-containing protein n=1 Tax=uncultured Xylophilus sp. TaxID=296832 RepID=UPI0025D11661|nr:YXWGXW repeat-containing protein [uncultured Xylophilus sp.]
MIAQKALFAASATVLSLAALTAVPAQAQIYVQAAPPPPRVEVVPPPRRGMVWSPGHWEWRNNRHVWVKGVWLRERPGYRYREAQWVDRGGRWEMRRGGWDRDGDGVPNRHDRRPNNPNRY